MEDINIQSNNKTSDGETQNPPTPDFMVGCYKECLRNHAAGIGGYAVDGCGEFMPAPEFDSSNPSSFKCVACGCHRNFHRRETPDSNNKSLKRRLQPSVQKSPPAVPPPQLKPPPSVPGQRVCPSPSSSTSPGGSRSIPSPESSPSPPPAVSRFSTPVYHASAPQILLSLGSSYNVAAAADHRHRLSLHQTAVRSENPCGRKRSRTKFSREQKEKMYKFSEKLGWKMQRVEDRMVQEFCNEVGVSRYVFKVWMHNNKNKRSNRNITSDRAISSDHVDRDGLNSRNFDVNNNVIDLKEEHSSGNLDVSANGSSP